MMVNDGFHGLLNGFPARHGVPQKRTLDGMDDGNRGTPMDWKSPRSWSRHASPPGCSFRAVRPPSSPQPQWWQHHWPRSRDGPADPGAWPGRNSRRPPKPSSSLEDSWPTQHPELTGGLGRPRKVPPERHMLTT